MIKYILAALAVVFTFNANADVRVLKYSDSNRYFIEITGEITRGDYDKFWNIVNNRQGLSDLVDLDSPGGDVWAAQQIANLISSRDMNTRVWKNRMCASACTDILVAGSDPIVYTSSRIGYHTGFVTDWQSHETRDDAYMWGQQDALQDATHLLRYVPVGKEWEAILFMQRVYSRSNPAIMYWATGAELETAGIVSTVKY